MLIECKHWSADLNPHNSQLFRYFHTTAAKFGILSNGITYKFYTDLVMPNRMDEKPFFEFRIDDLKENQIEKLKEFHKSYFNIESINTTASELKYINELKTKINNFLNDPGPEFVRFITKDIYPGVITQKVLDQFTQLSKKAFQQHLNDFINERLKSALQKEQHLQEVEEKVAEPTTQGVVITTTKEEYEAFHIVKSILRPIISWNRVYMRDAQSYCAVLLDDNNRKPICRLYFNTQKKSIAILDSNKKEIKYELKSVDDIYIYSEQLLEAIKEYTSAK